MDNSHHIHYTSMLLKVLLIPLALAALIILSFARPGAAKAAGSPPTWGLPYASGTSGLYTGESGLHGCNFSGIDTYTFANPSSDCSSPQNDASLDIGFNGSDGSGNGAAPAVALASGTVLDANAGCNLVLIDQGNGWWAIYIHLVSLQVTTGQQVVAGQALGTPNKNVTACHQSVVGNFPHVHFALLNSTGAHTATYVSMAGQVLCGSAVLSNSQAPGGPVGSGWVNNLQGLTSPFTVPNCPGSQTPGNIEVTSGLSAPASATIGQSFSASFTVTNVGQQNFTLSSLAVVATDPNGHTFTVQTDNNNAPIPGGQTRSFTASTGNFGTGCGPCVKGTYTISADWQDSSGHLYVIKGSPSGTGSVQSQVADISSDVGVVNPHSGVWPMDVEFKRGSDGNIYEHDHQTWATGWAARDPNGVNFIGNPQPMMYSSTDMALFMRDSSGQIWNDYTSNAVWQGWHALPMNGGAAAGDITQYLNPISHATEILWVGTDGNVWHNYGNWTNAGPLTTKPAGVTFTGRVTEIANPNTQPNDDVDFYAHDTSGGIWHTTWGNNGTAQWSQLPGSTLDNITAAINYYGDGYGVEIFYVNNVDENVHYEMAPTYADNVVAGLPSGAWFAIDGAVDPSYDGFNPPVTELFVRDIYGNLWHNAYNAGVHAWNTSWDEFAGSSPVGMTGDPFVLVNNANAFILHSRALDGAIWTNSYPWNQWSSIGATP